MNSRLSTMNIATIRRQESERLSPPWFVALAPHSPVKESSGKIAAMVLKNVKASQGNVYPVDISERYLNFICKTNGLPIILPSQDEPVLLRIWSSIRQFLENSHLYASSARDERGPNPVTARCFIPNSSRPTAET